MKERMGRRGLLGALLGADEEAKPRARTPEVEAASGFSLAAFYAERALSPAPPLPHVELRAGLPTVPTTRVGLCPPAEELDLEELVRLEREREEARS